MKEIRSKEYTNLSFVLLCSFYIIKEIENQQPIDSTQDLSFVDLLDETLSLSQLSRWQNQDEDP